MAEHQSVDISRRRLFKRMGGIAAAGTVLALANEMPASAVAVPGVSGINVKDLGALGDGVTDDSTAIQAALDLVDFANHKQGRVVYFPSGIYMLSKSLRFEAGQRWVGEQSSWVSGGSGATRIVAMQSGNFTNGTTPEPYLAKFDGDYWHWGSFENISFDGSNVAGLGGLRFKSLGE